MSESSNDFIFPQELFPFLYDREPDSHKGCYGHALLVAGSRGKMGAAVLAARACLRSGVGLLTVHVPRCGVDIMQTAVPEAMLSIDDDEAIFTSLPSDISRYDAVAVGPGLGTQDRSRQAMAELLNSIFRNNDKGNGGKGQGLVIDADGLNMLARMPEMMHAARHAVLTPHDVEYRRLFADSDTQRMCDLHEVFIVRKGHRSVTFAPGMPPVRNTTGNPAMATAGSGDVLTGVMLSLLSQCRAYSAHGMMDVDYSAGYIQQVASLAVCLHGRAGDVAACRRPQASVVASDMVDALLV